MAQHTCLIDGCEKAISARSLCKQHYQRARYLGTRDDYPVKELPPAPPCRIAGCPRRGLRSRHGLCKTHYARVTKGIRTMEDVGRRGQREKTIEERFWEKVTKTETCWLWTGATITGNYGRFWVSDSRPRVPAHRFSYEVYVGPIPEGLVVDHLCSNPPCVNPAHLEPVTQWENLRRSFIRRAGPPVVSI
jgi:hypothetical protein